MKHVSIEINPILLTTLYSSKFVRQTETEQKWYYKQIITNSFHWTILWPLLLH